MDNQTSDKKYIAYWGKGYVETVEIKSLTFFNHDLGYNDDDITKVKNLKIGETVDLSTESGKHIVTRVE